MAGTGSPTTRDIGPEGFRKKNRSWNDREMLESQREQWAEACNRHLSRAGHEIRIDHRSLSAQGIEREPTIHQGVHATAMQRRIEQVRESGKVLAFPLPDRCVRNREIVKRNEQVQGISAKIIDLSEARGRIEEAMADYRRDLIKRGEWEPFGCRGEREAMDAARKEATDKWREEERERTRTERERRRQAVRGDFVQDPLARKEKEVLPEGPGSPAGEPAADRFHIEVPFEEKDAAKAKGAWWDAQKRSLYVPAGVDRTPFEKWFHTGEGEPRKTPAGREIAAQDDKPEETPATSWREAAEQEQSLQAEEARRMEREQQADDLARYIAEGVSRMKARARQWSVDKKAAAMAREKALAEERAAKEKALAIEKAAQEAERDRRVEMSAVFEKEANRSAWQGKRPIVEAAVKEHPELAGTTVALEALARQPGFFSVSFEDRNRLMKAIGKASKLIEKGEPLRGAKDPRVEKIAREAAKEYKLENERGMER